MVKSKGGFIYITTAFKIKATIFLTNTIVCITGHIKVATKTNVYHSMRHSSNTTPSHEDGPNGLFHF